MMLDKSRANESINKGMITNQFIQSANITSEKTFKGSISKNSKNVGTFTGSITETLLKGDSAYDIAVKYGYTGTEEEWIKNFEQGAYEFSIIDETDDSFKIKIKGNSFELITPELLKTESVGSISIERIDEILSEVNDE